MPSKLNFRGILGVEPDSPGFSCVGTNKDGVTRCGNRISINDRSKANAMLDEMDTGSLKSSYAYLEELAYLTLCARWHRKPDRSQVPQVCRPWRKEIRKVEKVVAEAKEAAAARKAAAKRSERRLAAKASYATSEEESEEKENKDKIPKSSSPDSGYPVPRGRTRVSPDEPFVAGTKPSDPFANDTTPTQEVTPAATLVTQSPRFRKSDDSLQSRSGETEAKSSNRQISPGVLKRILELPSPPATELRAKEKDSREPRYNADVPSTPTKQFKDLAQAQAIEREDRSSGSFNPDYRSSVETPIRAWQETPTSAITCNLNFNFTPSPNHWLETPMTTPESRMNRGKALDFGTPTRIPLKKPSAESLSTSSTAVRLPEESSNIWDNRDEPSNSESGKVSLQDSSKRPARKSLPRFVEQAQKTSVRPPTPPETLLKKPVSQAEASHTTPLTSKEGFGHVIIKPATRSKTYIPATQQQHGLLTPPRELDIREAAVQNDLFTSGAVSYPSLSIRRKPLGMRAEGARLETQRATGYTTFDHREAVDGRERYREQAKRGVLRRFLDIRHLWRRIVPKAELFGMRGLVRE